MGTVCEEQLASLHWVSDSTGNPHSAHNHSGGISGMTWPSSQAGDRQTAPAKVSDPDNSDITDTIHKGQSGERIPTA
jgi:hypothetical protein